MMCMHMPPAQPSPSPPLLSQGEASPEPESKPRARALSLSSGANKLKKKLTAGYFTLQCTVCGVQLEERPAQQATLGKQIGFPGGYHLTTCTFYKKQLQTTLNSFPPAGESKLVMSSRICLLCG